MRDNDVTKDLPLAELLKRLGTSETVNRRGLYHKVSVKHLDSYLDELEWRYNTRENPYLFRASRN